jgi:hypothetical protein
MTCTEFPPRTQLKQQTSKEAKDLSELTVSDESKNSGKKRKLDDAAVAAPMQPKEENEIGKSKVTAIADTLEEPIVVRTSRTSTVLCSFHWSLIPLYHRTSDVLCAQFSEEFIEEHGDIPAQDEESDLMLVVGLHKPYLPPADSQKNDTFWAKGTGYGHGDSGSW